MKLKKTSKLLVFVLMAVFLAACGGDQNRSSSNRSNGGIGGFGYPGGTNFGNGTSLPNNWVDILLNENPCIDYNTGQLNNARTRVVVPLQGMNVNAGSLYAGITYEGDVGIVSNQGGQPVMEIFSCLRPDLATNSRGYIVSQNGVPPVLNVSRNCAVGEVTAMDIGLETQLGGYLLKFYPIYLNSMNSRNNGSSICQ